MAYFDDLKVFLEDFVSGGTILSYFVSDFDEIHETSSVIVYMDNITSGKVEESYYYVWRRNGGWIYRPMDRLPSIPGYTRVIASYPEQPV